MFRTIYLTAMAASIGAIAAACLGHPALWMSIGTALGPIWSKLASEPATMRRRHRRPGLASWVNQIVTLRRVTFVIGAA